MSQPNYLTPEGEAKLKAELEELKGPRREELAARLRSAIQMGDLSENADYHKAKEDQASSKGASGDRSHPAKLSPHRKIGWTRIVSIGSHVTIQEEGFDPETYHLVGPAEADPRNGRISHESPIGVAMMAKRSGM
jgi:transcription elongation factor GreA